MKFHSTSASILPSCQVQVRPSFATLVEDMGVQESQCLATAANPPKHHDPPGRSIQKQISSDT